MEHTQFARYRLDEELARDEVGRVVRAYDTERSRPVLLWLIQPAPRTGETWRATLERLQSVQHPHLPEIYEVGEADGLLFAAGEFPTADSLDEKRRAGEPVSETDLAKIAVAVSAALGTLHRHSLRIGITPDRLVCDERGRLLLLTLGAARSKTGLQAGVDTDAFAPEQSRGRPVDQRADWYALGCVLYELATGRPPHRASTALAAAIKHASEPPPSPRALNPGLSARAEALLLGLLAKDPAERITSAAGVRQALGQDGPAGARLAAVPGTERRRVPALAMAAAAVLAVLALVFGVPQILRARDPRPAAVTAPTAPEPEVEPVIVQPRAPQPQAVAKPKPAPAARRRTPPRVVQSPRRATPRPSTPAATQTVRRPATPEPRRAPKRVATARPTPQRQTRRTRAGNSDDVAAAVHRWNESLRQGDLDTHVSQYAPQVERYFRKESQTRTQVIEDKRRHFGRNGRFEKLQIRNLRVKRDRSGDAIAEFDKEWDLRGARPSAGAEQQRLRLRKVSGKWKIVSEQETRIYRVRRGNR